MESTSSVSPAVIPVSRTSQAHCNYCSFCSDDNLIYTKHVFQAHCTESNFHYVCGITDCPHAFKTGAIYTSFLTHCNRKHSNWREVLRRNLCLQFQIPLELEHNGQPDAQEAMDPDRQQFDHSHDLYSSNELTVSNEDVELAAARFLLTLKEKYRLTQASLKFALESVGDIINVTCRSIEHAVHQELSESGISPSPCCFHTPDPFSNLKTEYQQTKFYRDHFGLIVRNNRIRIVFVVIRIILSFRNPSPLNLARLIGTNRVVHLKYWWNVRTPFNMFHF